jgi:hypothetical protein
MWYFVIHINETEPYTGVMDGNRQKYYTMHPSRGSLPLKHQFIATEGSIRFITHSLVECVGPTFCMLKSLKVDHL